MQNRSRGLVRLCLALIGAPALVVVSACSTTQTAGRQLDDNAIHTKVKAALTSAHFSNLTNIDINVTNGVVTLAGEVRDEKVRAEAERVTRNIDGVVAVHNNLQIEHHAALER